VTQPGIAPTERVAPLDGLRAVSILLVILHHLKGTAGAPAFFGVIGNAIDAGNLGVRVFFVISGYLITGLLLRELERTGTISLRTFYWRRTLRIFPPAYAYLAVLAVLVAIGTLALTGRDLVAGFTYTMNFYLGPWTPRQWQVGHLWSLAVEEQFYLLWPAVLLTLGVRRSVVLVASLVVLVPALRVAALFGIQPAPVTTVAPFLFNADWLAAGSLLALGRSWLLRIASYRTIRATGWWSCVLVASGLAAWSALGHWRVRELTSVWTLVAVTLLIEQITGDVRPWAVRWLAWRPVVWIGRVSYSLYLWQELFCNRYVHTWYTAFPANVVLAFAAASASYYGIERPVLAWRDRSRHAKPA
jgi:peptidoglycan/LPS O-acetylase OafA/YrhL